MATEGDPYMNSPPSHFPHFRRDNTENVTQNIWLLEQSIFHQAFEFTAMIKIEQLRKLFSSPKID